MAGYPSHRGAVRVATSTVTILYVLWTALPQLCLSRAIQAAGEGTSTPNLPLEPVVMYFNGSQPSSWPDVNSTNTTGLGLVPTSASRQVISDATCSQGFVCDNTCTSASYQSTLNPLSFNEYYSWTFTNVGRLKYTFKSKVSCCLKWANEIKWRQCDYMQALMAWVCPYIPC